MVGGGVSFQTVPDSEGAGAVVSLVEPSSPCLFDCHGRSVVEVSAVGVFHNWCRLSSLIKVLLKFRILRLVSNSERVIW